MKNAIFASSPAGSIFEKASRASLVAFGLLAVTSLAHAQSPAQRDATAGSAKISMCVGCHSIPGYKASFPSVYDVPMISGQSQKYIENALVAYKKGERNHPTMKAIAASLSEADMAALAAYYSKNTGTAAK